MRGGGHAHGVAQLREAVASVHVDAFRVLRGTRGGEGYELPAVVLPTLDGWQYGTEELGAT